MRVLVGKYAGFCSGVRKAVSLALSTPNAVLLGDLVHNDKVVRELCEKGVGKAEVVRLKDTQIMVVGADGCTQKEYTLLQGKNWVDATCPRVGKSIKIAQNTQKNRENLLLLGDKMHDECVNVTSYCERVFCVETQEDIERLPLEKGEVYVVIAQTTMATERYEKLLLATQEKARASGAKLTLENTLCPEVQLRVEEAKSQAKKADVVLVLGDEKSANTRELYNVTLSQNKNTYFVHSATDHPPLNGVEKALILAGASVDPQEVKELAEKVALDYAATIEYL